MGSISFPFVLVPLGGSFSVLARNPHKGSEHETGSGREKENPREEDSQLTKEGRREQSA